MVIAKLKLQDFIFTTYVSFYHWILVLIMLTVFFMLTVYPPMPDTITNEEKRSAQLRRMIDIRVDPIDGLTSNWDYDNNRWKK